MRQNDGETRLQQALNAFFMTEIKHEHGREVALEAFLKRRESAVLESEAATFTEFDQRGKTMCKAPVFLLHTNMDLYVKVKKKQNCTL